MQCVAPTQLAVIKIVTQTPKYIFFAESEQHDSFNFVSFRVGCSMVICLGAAAADATTEAGAGAALGVVATAAGAAD